MVDGRDLYSQVYYDSNETVYFNDTVVRTFGSTSTFFRGSLILLLRAGYILIQTGCTPVSDVQMILLQNIMDIAFGTATYSIVGYILAFGHDAGGLVGRESWIMSDHVDMSNAVLGWAAVITATSIFTTMVAGRMHFVGYVTVTILFAMIIQPIFMHWTWSNSGWMYKSAMSNHKVSFKDQAGGCVIHVTGGVLALIGGLALGRRILRLRDIDESSLPPDSPGNAVAGYIFLIIGLMGLCLPTPTYERSHFPVDYIGITIINNMLALAGGIIAVVILQFVLTRDMFDYWVIIRCMQGAIAGIVTVAAGIDVYKPLVAFGLSIVGTLLFFVAARLSFTSSMEDYSNVVPVHLLCGLFGALLPPICGSSENLGTSHNMIIHFGWQVMCSLTILGAMFLFTIPLFLVLHCCGFLRSRSEERNHRRALTAIAGGPRRHFLQRIFTLDEEYQQYLQPGYRTKHEANFMEETNEQQLEVTHPQVTPMQSSYSTKNESTSVMKSHAQKKTHQPLAATLEKSKQLSHVLKLNEDEISEPKRTRKNKSSEKNNSVSQHKITELLKGTKRKRQLFTVQSTGQEDLLTGEHARSMEGGNSTVTKVDQTSTNLYMNSEEDDYDDAGTEIVHIKYRKYMTPKSYGQDFPISGAISCLSHISNILKKHLNQTHAHLSAHDIGEGDCVVHVKNRNTVSNFPQRSTSAPNITNIMLQNWGNSLEKPEISNTQKSKQVSRTEIDNISANIQSYSSVPSELNRNNKKMINVKSLSTLHGETRLDRPFSGTDPIGLLLPSTQNKNCTEQSDVQEQNSTLHSKSWYNLNFDDSFLLE